MNYRKKIGYLIALAIIFGVIGYALIDLIVFEFDTCGAGYESSGILSEKVELSPSCTGYRDFVESLDDKIGVPFVLFSGISLLILFILLFLQEEVFKSWFKFARIFLPITIVLIIISSPNDGDMLFPSTEEMATFALPVIFLVASLVIITLKSLKLRKK